MQNIDLVLFDLDGTITDPAEGIHNSIARALFAMGRPMLSEEITRRFIGPALFDSFQRYCGMGPDEAREAIVHFRAYYGERGMYECYVFDGVVPLLRRLREAGLRLGVATSKAEPFAKRLLAHYGLDKYLDCVSAASLDSTANEKADLLRRALAAMGITDPRRAVMVGDREFDIAGAKATGLRSVGITYGYGSEEELRQAGADFLAATPAEVGDAILGIRG